jgi:hypothetical protein
LREQKNRERDQTAEIDPPVPISGRSGYISITVASRMPSMNQSVMVNAEEATGRLVVISSMRCGRRGGRPARGGAILLQSMACLSCSSTSTAQTGAAKELHRPYQRESSFRAWRCRSHEVVTKFEAYHPALAAIVPKYSNPLTILTESLDMSGTTTRPNVPQ